MQRLLQFARFEKVRLAAARTIRRKHSMPVKFSMSTGLKFGFIDVSPVADNNVLPRVRLGKRGKKLSCLSRASGSLNSIKSRFHTNVRAHHIDEI